MDAEHPQPTLDSRYKRAQDTSWSRLGDEVLVMQLQARRSHRLTGAAVPIWDRVIEGDSLAQVVETLQNSFDVDGTTLSSDVLSTVSLFLRESLIESA
ncbi:MAG: PqqD family protein [Planctomycetes bacterium]|nr:PqqD family protein [Planctomycetota bacterium]